jgi:hypothetical protein
MKKMPLQPAELEELPLKYRFDVQALNSITYEPLLEHIRRVGIEIYSRFS